MPMLELIALHTEEGAGFTPWLVGGSSLLVLLILLAGILTFGKGREHS